MPNSIKRREYPPNVICFPAFKNGPEAAPSTATNAATIAKLPPRRSNDELIKAYLAEVKIICLRIETLMAMSDMSEI